MSGIIRKHDIILLLSTPSVGAQVAQRIDRGDLHRCLWSQGSICASHDDPMAHAIAVELAGSLLDDLPAMRED